MAYRRLPALAAILISFSLQAYAGTVGLLPVAVNGLQVDVNGGASNGNLVTIAWNWGNGQLTTGFFPQSHTYSAKGRYSIQVTARYQDGSTASASQTVNVGPGIIQNCFALTISAENGGSVSFNASVGAGTLSAGQSITLKLAQSDYLSLAATANQGSVFSGWTASAGITGFNATSDSTTSSPITILVTEPNSQITANFDVTPNTAPLTVQSAPSVNLQAPATDPAGRTFYVDSVNGKDSANGLTPATAWKTIAHVVYNSTLLPGDSVLFNRGQTWKEELDIPASGSSSANISFGAYGTGANPIFDGANQITTWTPYVLPPSSINPLFPQAGSPASAKGVNVGLTTDYEGTPVPSVPDIGAIEFTNVVNLGAPDLPAPAIYQSTLTWTPTQVLQNETFLMNVPWNTNIATTAAAMSPGTWTFDPINKILYVWCFDRADPSTQAILATRVSGIVGKGKSYITIQNITLIHANYAGLDTGGGNNWLVDGVVAYRNGNYGIKASGGSANCVFQNCDAYNCGGGSGGTAGIGANGATNLTVQSCTSHDNNAFKSADGMQFNNVTGLLVEYCDVYNNNNTIGTSSDNCQLNNVTGAIIRYNHFANGANSSIIFTGTNSSGTVYYNVIEGGLRWGICVDDTSGTQTSNITVYNNTIYGVAQYPLGVMTTGTGTITFKNNIAWGTTYALYVLKDVNPSKIILDYNLYFNNSGNPFYWNGVGYATLALYKTASGQDGHSLYANPIFMLNP